MQRHHYCNNAIMMKRLWVKLFIFILLPVGLFVVGELYAANKFDIKVSDDLTGAEQSQPRVAVGYSGEIAVVWADKRNGYSAIYYQYLDSNGVTIGANKKMGGISATSPQYEPSLNANLLGQFAAVWRDYRNGAYPFNPDIYYARMDTSGAGTNHAVTETRLDSTCQAPDIAVLPNGNVILVWADYRNKNWDIYGQRFNSSGGAIGSNFKINNDNGTYQQHSPRVAALSNGGFVVVWYDNREGDDNIYGRRYDANAQPVGNDLKINDDTSGKRQAWPSISADGNGRFFVAWVDWRNGNYPDNPDIYFRRYNSGGNPMEESRKISSASDNSTSQRDVSLCSDRMGNLGIVWADSSTGQWNAIGRIVDSEGEITNEIFQIHQNTGGRQRQPDIATDGYKFFFVWADDRSGDFDIYLTIKDYNNPTILVSPTALHFTMDESDPAPPSKAASISNAGYGELHWECRVNVDWIGVNPDSSMTPDDIAISIVTDTLPYGEYFGEIRLVDLDNGDSTVVIPVSLSVTAPILDLVPDTISFRVLAELGNPAPKVLAVNNAGSGTLNWAASENASWFELSSTGGSAPDSLGISLDVSGMMYGEYAEPIEFTSSEAVNSPQTAWVSLSLTGNMPYISPSPGILNLYGTHDDVITGEIRIQNLGSGSLLWTACSETSWINLDPSGGIDDDIISVEASTSLLNSGIHTGEIIVYDSASFNVDTAIIVNLYLSSADSLEFFDANTMPGGTGVVPLRLTLSDAAKEIYIPFTYDTTTAVLDSIIFDFGTLQDIINPVGTIGEAVCEIGVSIIPELVDDIVIPAGYYDFAMLYFTAGESDAICEIDTVSSDTSGLYIKNASLQKTVPAVFPGNLYIGNPTDIGDETSDGPLPEEFDLAQNIPNPFNISTRIDIYLPQGGDARLSIYNILGQEVRVLHDGFLPSGPSSFAWDGNTRLGTEAATGIYFYQFQSGDYAAVRKMLLLK